MSDDCRIAWYSSCVVVVKVIVTNCDYIGFFPDLWVPNPHRLCQEAAGVWVRYDSSTTVRGDQEA